jgi:hypothetical protein
MLFHFGFLLKFKKKISKIIIHVDSFLTVLYTMFQSKKYNDLRLIMYYHNRIFEMFNNEVNYLK